jgi:hypothetical protein
MLIIAVTGWVLQGAFTPRQMLLKKDYDAA